MAGTGIAPLGLQVLHSGAHLTRSVRQFLRRTRRWAGPPAPRGRPERGHLAADSRPGLQIAGQGIPCVDSGTLLWGVLQPPRAKGNRLFSCQELIVASNSVPKSAYPGPPRTAVA